MPGFAVLCVVFGDDQTPCDQRRDVLAANNVESEFGLNQRRLLR